MQQRYHCIGHRRFRGGGLQLWRIPGNVKFPHREISGIPHPCVASACTTLLPDSSGTEEPTLISPHSTLLFTHLDTSHLQDDACIFAWPKTPKDPRKHWKRGFDFAAVLVEKYRATTPTRLQPYTSVLTISTRPPSCCCRTRHLSIHSALARLTQHHGERATSRQSSQTSARGHTPQSSSRPQHEIPLRD
jgi:hypothetical protein